MTYTKQDIVEDAGDLSWGEFLVLFYLKNVKKAYKTTIMRDLINRYGDSFEHGPYEGYGREYCDEIDEGVESMRGWGAIAQDHDSKWYITQYGIDLVECLMSGLYAWDEPVEKMIERVKE
jgi:hypothetical protein